MTYNNDKCKSLRYTDYNDRKTPNIRTQPVLTKYSQLKLKILKNKLQECFRMPYRKNDDLLNKATWKEGILLLLRILWNRNSHLDVFVNFFRIFLKYHEATRKFLEMEPGLRNSKGIYYLTSRIKVQAQCVKSAQS